MTVRRNGTPTSSCGLRGGRPVSLEDMPLDIIYPITDHSPIQSLVALGTVSKRFRGLLNNRGIWKKAYKKSTFLVPQGPYKSQSTSYLISVLLRSERLHSVWSSLSTRPKISLTGCIMFSHDATLSVLLGRWLLVAEGAGLTCYDSHRRNISESTVTLRDPDVSDRILRVLSVGTIQEDGILAVVVLLFKHAFTIAKIIMDQEKPSGLQTVLTSTPPVVTGWIDLVDVRLYHRLLVMNIGECSADWESSGRLVIMDIGSLRRYHITASTDGVFDPIHTTTFFLATQTHLIKVMESCHGSSFQSRLECFELPSVRGTPEGDYLCPSHQYQVVRSMRVRECDVIRESPIDAGKISFTFCGLDNSLPSGAVLKAMDVCLEPDGSVSLTERPLLGYPIKFCCIGWSGGHGRGVAVTAQGQILAFALRHYGRSFVHRTLLCKPGTSELLAVDTFGGVAFFSRRWSDHMSVEMVDFSRDAQNQGHGCTTGPYGCDSGGVCQSIS